MSFVGARPEVRKYVDRYTEEMMATLLMPAGVTSLASISFKDEDDTLAIYLQNGKSLDDAYVNEVLPKKMKYNLSYLNECCFCFDIKIMIKTVMKVLLS